MRFSLLSALIAAAPLAQAAADLTVLYPPPRTEKQHNTTCFFRNATDLSSISRTPLPLTGSAPLALSLTNPSGSELNFLSAALNWGENPRAFGLGNETFRFTYGDGTEEVQVGYGVLERAEVKKNGTICTHLDLSTLQTPSGKDLVHSNRNGTTSTTIANGTVATLYVVYSANNGGDRLESCSDVVLVSDYSPPADVKCENVTTGAGDGNGALHNGAASAVGGVAAVVAAMVGGLW